MNGSFLKGSRLFNKITLSPGFVRNTAILVSGTGIAQLIPIIMQLILRRTYSIEDFGAFSVYMSILSPFAVIALFRYEMAIVIPAEKRDASNIFAISLITNVIFVTALLITIMFLKDQLVSLFNFPKKYSYYLYFLPFGIFLFGANQSINYFLIREKAFKSSAINKISRRIAEGSAQVIFGVFRQPVGLIIGDILGNMSSNISGIRQLMKLDFQISDITKERIISLFKSYSSFPKFNLLPAILDTITVALPVLFINKFFSTAYAGYFDLTQVALVAPMSLISVSISQVLLQNISEKKNKREEIKHKIYKLGIILSGLGIIFAVIIFYFGPQLFSFAFGPKWELSGKYSGILIFAYVLRFIISSISIVLISLEKIKLLSLWQLLYFLLIGSLVFFQGVSFEQFLKLFVLFNFLAYSVYALLIIRVINSYEKTIITVPK